MTNEDLKNLIDSQSRAPEFPGVPFLPQKLQVISDISADSNGSLEFVVDCTSMEEPFEVVDGKGSSSRDPKSPGVVVTSIDYLPALLPREASDHFGNCLLPFIDDLLNLASGQGDVCPAIRNAVICQNGALTTQYRYISDMRAAQTSSKSILVLGAGYVSAPVVDYLSSKGYKVTVVSSVENEAAKMISQYNFENCTPVVLNCINDNEGLSSLISSHDLTISLLPYVFHPHVCEKVISAGKQMVTASYLSDGMAALDEKAKAAGITVMNEVGVDPGIDHMLAMELFDELKDNGEDVQSFVSFCGGLPAPEASNNVLGYKFSWSPRGVLLNTVSGAKWLHNGDVDEILPGGDIINRPYTFSGDVKEVPFTTWNGYSLEGLPNRDSTKYTIPYQIPKCETLLRGTFRYAGYCEVLRDLQAVNLINEAPSPNLYDADNWLEFMALHLGLDKNSSAVKVMAKASELKNGLGKNVNTNKLAKLGVFTKTNKLENRNSPLDALAMLLNRDMQYGEAEKDAIIMRHEVKTHQNPTTTHGVDFIYYGDQGKNDGKEYSAMAQTVGYPAAISAHLIMEGVINKPGMLTPVTKDIYVPILDELKKLGIVGKRTLN